MNTTLRSTLIVASVIVVAAILLLTGLWIGRMGWGMGGPWPGGMMNTNLDGPTRTSYETGMMPNGMMNQGMMNGNSMMNGNGMMQNGIMGGNAMMNQMMSGGDMMGGGMMMNGNLMGTGMMSSSGLYASLEPLSLETAKQALEKFLSAQANDDLAISEIMIFDNHAYAEIIETSTGIGAMELLVDPVTLAVTPEHGPNRMWNLKYGMMAGYGGGMMGTMMGGGLGMMGNYGTTPNQPAEVSAEMPITLEEAVESAQRYLDTYLSGSQVDDHADVFYGYYTLHVLRDGQIVGMLSVNGYTREVFLHTWHGDFIEMGGGGE